MSLEDYRQQPNVFIAFALPTLIWLLLFFIAPLGIIGLYSFGENISLVDIKPTGTLDNYARIFQPEILVLLWRSLWIAGIATVLCLAIAYPVALVIASAPADKKPWLLLLIMLPFWTNLLIRTYALLNILGTRGRLNEVLGWLWETANSVLTRIGLGEWQLIGESFTPLKMLGTPAGVIFGIVYVSLPFAILPIYSSLERLNKSFLEASLDLGAGQWKTFYYILLPLTMAGVVTAAIITFIPALGQFLTPDLLGRGQVDMIANVIERQFKRANDWPFGSALSLFLLYITFVLLAIRAFYDARRRHRS